MDSLNSQSCPSSGWSEASMDEITISTLSCTDIYVHSIIKDHRARPYEHS